MLVVVDGTRQLTCANASVSIGREGPPTILLRRRGRPPQVLRLASVAVLT
jgi:hypothetical protein